MRRSFIGLVMMAMLGSCGPGSDGPVKPSVSSYVVSSDSAHQPIIAKVNGREIPLSLLRRLVPLLEKENDMIPNPQVPSQATSPEEEILEKLIDLELLAQRAEALGIKVTADEVDGRLNAIKTRLGEQGYRQALEDEGITEEEHRVEIQRSMEIERLLEKEVYSKVTTTRQEVEAYYNAHLQRFNRPEQLKLRQILVGCPEGAPDSQRKEARQKIERALERIRSGEPFAIVAREVSDDPSGSKGGDLGWVKKGQLDKELEDAVFSLTTGQMSQIIESKKGYHIFKVEGWRRGYEMPPEKAKAMIEATLKLQKRQQALTLYLEELRAQATIEKFLLPKGNP